VVLREVLTALVPLVVALAAVAVPVVLTVRWRRWSPLAVLLWAGAVVAVGWWLVESIELADATDGDSGPWGVWRWLVVAVVASGSAALIAHLWRARAPR
jgi:hypothetical protein